MERINIEITKESGDILIKNDQGGEFRIPDSNKELRASETLNFLNYNENKYYVLKELDESVKNDKNIQYVYKIFEEIIEKINPEIEE